VVYDARGNGNGDVAGTLTGDHQNRVTDYTSLVAYGISSYDSNAMKSPNPHAGIYEAKTARTLDTQGGSPACNQGGMAVVAFAENQRSEVRDLRDCAGALAAQPGMKQQTFIAQEKPVYSLEGNGQRPSHKGSGVSEEVSPTLNSVEQHQVAYAMTTGNYTQVCEEKAPCLQARDYKDPPIISRPHYIVRRLTPKECAVLQGFPRDWCAGLETPEPTEEDIAFWAEVFETQRRVIGTSKKPKSRSQIIKWLQNPHTDGKEYQLWGNGLCADCASFVLQAVVAIAQDVVE
jgi:DNA (cytosine-5)-methyltransferase 1